MDIKFDWVCGSVKGADVDEAVRRLFHSHACMVRGVPFVENCDSLLKSTRTWPQSHWGKREDVNLISEVYQFSIPRVPDRSSLCPRRQKSWKVAGQIR